MAYEHVTLPCMLPSVPSLPFLSLAFPPLLPCLPFPPSFSLPFRIHPFAMVSKKLDNELAACQQVVDPSPSPPPEMEEMSLVAIYCDVCTMWLNGQVQFKDHQVGKKHRRGLVQLLQWLGIPPCTIRPPGQVLQELKDAPDITSLGCSVCDKNKGMCQCPCKCFSL